MTEAAERKKPAPPGGRRDRPKRSGPDPGRIAAGIPGSAVQYLEKLSLDFARPVVDLSQNLASGMMAALQTLLRTAYLRGRTDMLEEVQAAERRRNPAVMMAAPVAGPPPGPSPAELAERVNRSAARLTTSAQQGGR